MPKKETKTLLITLLLIDLVSAGVFMFLFNFTKGQITESIDREDEIKMELKREDTRVLMKKDIALGEKYQEELSDYMIPKGGTVDFIKTIENLVSNSGLKSDIKSVLNESYDKGNAIGAELLKVNMDVIGGWSNVQFFLKSLENYPLKIEIKKASFSKFSDFTVQGKKIPQWTGSFEFTIVKLKETK